LPSDAFTVQGDGYPARSGLGDGSPNEGATVQGNPGSGSTVNVQPRKNVSVTVQQPARSSSAGRDSVTRGKDVGGSGKRGSGGGTMLASGEPGNGRSRISSGQVHFRSWAAPSPVRGQTTLQVALTSHESIEGDIELVTLGAGGAPEPDYTLPILSAHMVIDGTPQSVEWEGNVFKDVKLVEGWTTRLEIDLEAGHRYRLDVK
jgi:hypothetical protein